MISDNNMSMEHSNEQPEKEKNESPQSEKSHGDNTNELTKPKRRGRRGKKRKQRKGIGGAPCVAEHSEECGSINPVECEKHGLSWDDEEEDIEVEDYKLLGNVLIRPIDVPKAPENSTQFIIDDHDECRLYMSFETPNPYIADYLRSEEDNSEIIEPDGEDAAYVDINYEYESPHDFDNSAYYDREFELSYKNNRFDELMRLPRNDLVSGLQNLENHLRTLNEDLVKEDPNPILERLQAELLELQEKHFLLKEQNATLQEHLLEAGLDQQTLTMEEARNSNSLKDSDSEIDQLQMQTELCDHQEKEAVLLCSGDRNAKQEVKQSTLNSGKQDSKSPCHVTCVDASNKENACYVEEHLQNKLSTRLEPCHLGECCGENIPVKEKVLLRDSESQLCEDIPLNAVSEEHEPNAVSV